MPNEPSSDFELLAEARYLAATGEARRIRHAVGATVTEIAEQVGRTHATVSRWENGLRTPRGDAGVKYGELLRKMRKAAKRATVAEIRAAAKAKAAREAAAAATATKPTIASRAG